MHAVLTLGNASDLTKVPLQGVLTPAVIMTVSMTASATRGRTLAEDEWQRVQDGCEAAKSLKEARDKVRLGRRLGHWAPREPASKH
jgi:U4/U6 small nuclear ribonucleoprotein PRP31